MGNFKGSDDYIDVTERVQDFLDTYPTGTLQTDSWEVLTVTGLDEGPKSRTKGEQVTRTFIVCKVSAYRTPDDPRPGTAVSFEPFPGHTNFTLNSELENAETSARGRAIVALGLAANKGMVTRQEVRNRIAEQQEAAEATAGPTNGAAKSKPARVPKVTAEERSALVSLYVEAEWDQETLCLQLVLIDALDGKVAEALGKNPTDEQYAALVGPAMASLSSDQYATVMASLRTAVEQKNAKAAA